MAQALRRLMGLLCIRDYRLFFFGTSVSMLGTGMEYIATSWLALQITGESHSVALVLVCSALPGILLSPFIGVFVDRLNLRGLAIAMDLFRAAVLAALPAMWWADLLQPWHLYAGTFLLAAGDEAFRPTVMRLVREVVPPEWLLEANSADQIASQGGMLLGAALAGAIIAISSPLAVMVVDAGTFLISALCLGLMRHRSAGRPPIPAERGQAGAILSEMKEALAYIKGRPGLVPRYLTWLLLINTLHVMNVLLAPFAKDVLQVGAIGFGYIDAAHAIGALVGSAVVVWLSQRLSRQAIMVLGLGGMAVSLFFFGLSHHLLTAMLGYFLTGVHGQVRTIYLTDVQEMVPVQYQGRVHSFFTSILSVSALGFYLAMGYLSEVISQRWLYSFQGALIALAGLVTYLTIYRQGAGGARLAPCETSA